MFLGIVGLLMIFLIVYLLISGKSNAMVIFVIVPIIAALLCGFAPAVIFEFLKRALAPPCPRLCCSCSPLYTSVL